MNNRTYNCIKCNINMVYHNIPICINDQCDSIWNDKFCCIKCVPKYGLMVESSNNQTWFCDDCIKDSIKYDYFEGYSNCITDEEKKLAKLRYKKNKKDRNKNKNHEKRNKNK